MYFARRPHVRSDDGFTLIELLVTLVIVGVLVGIAVPAYAAFKGRSETKAAESDIRQALPSVQAFYLDNDTYVGLGNKPNKKPPGISYYDPGVKATVATGKGKPTSTTYCLTATVGGTTLSFQGPDTQTWFTTKNCTGAGSTTAP
ncbi:MAG TPA: prepilin-type N-terminal cleavage/methylation domain-containing protein [Gaiellaceae bacterium]|nr:prepilin-type N-terminal cleavage/methylation domain-containing protein [Gaiellaceae bacterium]